MFKIEFKSSEGIKLFEGGMPLFIFNIRVYLEDKIYSLNLKKHIFNEDIVLDNDSEFQKFDSHLKKYLQYNEKSYNYYSNEIMKRSLFLSKNILLGKCDIFKEPFEIKKASE